jgi:hypothetical protein
MAEKAVGDNARLSDSRRVVIGDRVDTKRAQELFSKYSLGMAYIAVEAPDGSQSIGSAFHVGEGVFVTARHVLENRRVLEVRPTVSPVHMQTDGLSLVSGPIFHPDDFVDVGAFRVNLPGENLPYLPLGTHLDDWFNDDQFVLSEAIVMGYPPIPMTTDPYLVAARAEVNCVINTWRNGFCHFILSSIPRGGFSGGVAISEWDFVLGVVTESLVMNNMPSELGFLNVISVEPILECLGKGKMLPACQSEYWDDFWSTETVFLLRPSGEPFDNLGVHEGIGCVEVCDDGAKLYLEVLCDDNALFEEAAHFVDVALSGVNIEQILLREHRMRWQAVIYNSANVELFRAIAGRAVALLKRRGIYTTCNKGVNFLE